MPLLCLLLLFIWPGSEGEELKGRALAKFLGPVPFNLCTWQRAITVGGEEYHGTAQSPRSGSVDIDVEVGEMCVFGSFHTGEKLGVFSTRWNRGTSDGHTYANAVVYDGDLNASFKRIVMISISGERDSDVDALIVAVSRLPMFNASTRTPFEPVANRKRLALGLNCIVFPSLLLAGVWLAERRLRQSGGNAWKRAAMIALIALLWSVLFMASVLFQSLRFPNVTAALLLGNLTPYRLAAPAIGLLVLAGAILFMVYLAIRKLICIVHFRSLRET